MFKLTCYSFCIKKKGKKVPILEFINRTDGLSHLTHLDDSVLTPLDGFAEVFIFMTL